MKIEDVKKRLLKIEKCKEDCEIAHCYEDDLFYDFVNAVKNGEYETKEEIIKVAKEVYKVRKISFARWYA